jgi:hypothetical protein
MALKQITPVTKKLTLNLLTTTIVAPSNASKWQMGFNSAFKGLRYVLLPHFASTLLLAIMVARGKGGGGGAQFVTTCKI